jgi:asparagine synthetase B (glutamine-hydrolysing)
MCGISGIWERGGCSMQDLERRLSAITQTLSHRESDDHRVWLSHEAPLPSGGVTLHLSICPEWDINQ